jgi:hypothetical protein
MGPTAGVTTRTMSARACTECGAAADDAADHCERCGVPLEARKLHEGSDVRIEPERLDAALPHDPSLPASRWGRVSDHPAPRAAGMPHDSEPQLAGHEPPTDAGPIITTAAAAGVEVSAHKIAGAGSAAGPSPELSNLLASDISVAVGQPALPGRGMTPEKGATNTTGSQAVVGRRPPVLASEALLRDLAPSRPARQTLRIWAPLLGCLGAAAVWLMTHGHGMGLPLAGAFGGLALLGLPPMPYAGRASAVVTVAATGLALVLWADATSAAGMPSIVLTLAVAVLATGLYFRAWHRASLMARLIVFVGAVSGATFLWMSGDLADLTVFDTAWQSWLPRVMGLSFGILLLLSLLAFMDARSTGGAAVWATFLVCWQALHAGVEIFRAAWPKSAASPDFSRVPTDILLALVSTPLLTTLFALGLAQLMAAGLSKPRPRVESVHFESQPPAHDFAGREARVPPQTR